jgi:6,7-dimethyl-8-ribityllumazine synthase
MAEVANSNLLQTATALPGVKGVTVVIIRTEWNDAIVGALEKGCREALEERRRHLQSDHGARRF